MSPTPPRYTPADYEQASNKWAPAVSDVGAWVEICTPLTCEEIDELHALLRQAAGQARVLDRLRDSLTERSAIDDNYGEFIVLLARLLREEGVTP